MRENCLDLSFTDNMDNSQEEVNNLPLFLYKHVKRLQKATEGRGS